MRYATIILTLREYGVTNDEILLCELIEYYSNLNASKQVCSLTTGELASVVGCSRRWGYYALKKLEGMGWVKRTPEWVALTAKFHNVKLRELNRGTI